MIKFFLLKLFFNYIFNKGVSAIIADSFLIFGILVK